MERWSEILGFDGYSVSNRGRIRNDRTGRIIRPSRNQNGVMMVGMMRDGRQQKRSVARLVASAFLPEPASDRFDTPIHLDGDKTNSHEDNLMWRPRWFASKYHAQFYDPDAFVGQGQIRDRHNRKKYANTRVACVKHGLLERELILSMMNRSYVFPTYQMFEVIE